MAPEKYNIKCDMPKYSSGFSTLTVSFKYKYSVGKYAFRDNPYAIAPKQLLINIHFLFFCHVIVIIDASYIFVYL